MTTSRTRFHRAARASAVVGLLAAGAASANAAAGLESHVHDLRLVPEAMVTLPGLEIGVALEYRAVGAAWLVARPEVFVNDDGDIGAGGALLWSLKDTFRFDRFDLAFGPRFAHHGAEDYSWSLGGMGLFSYALGGGNVRRHFIEALGELGVINDKDDDETEINLMAGVAYAFRFY